MKQHGIFKNLAGETVFNSQAATLVFLTGVAFKLSAAPAMISEEFGSSTFWAFALYSTIDVLIATLVFCFARKNGDALLIATNSGAYRMIALFATVFLTLKGIFNFSYASSYLTHELFEGLEPSLIYLLFLLPVVYLGARGIRPLSRTAEVFFPIIFLTIILNLVFLKTKTDFARVLPVFSKAPAQLAKVFPRYGLWLADMLPFAFVKIKDKRLPYLTIGITGTWLIVNLVALLGVAIYGNALKTVTDLLIRIAGFNQLSKDVGRTEWTNLLAVLTMSIISLAFSYFGALAACKRAVKTDMPIKIAFPLAILLVVLIVPSAQTVTDFATGKFGYAMFATALALPLLMTLEYARQRSKLKNVARRLEDEYLPNRPTEDAIDSRRSGVLDGFKNLPSKRQKV
ncbi:MAG: GerAB/ArcD/ProY family transporter [Clostridia bacterium]|nr:GerAB/ArcD/ProY family transporter [Clostridia bacterium]